MSPFAFGFLLTFACLFWARLKGQSYIVLTVSTKHKGDSIHYKPVLGQQPENGQSIVDLSQHFGRETARFGRIFISLE